jgi:hypothetical protein
MTYSKKMHKPLDVIFIAGSGRSGSTLLDRVLGTHPRASSHNELRAVPARGLGKNEHCACGRRFRECDFWKQVVKEADIDEHIVPAIIRQQLEIDRLRTFPRIFLGFAGLHFKQMLSQYRENLARLYRAISTVSGKQVIIDSTKIPTHALILLGIPGIRVHILHLVRDVRDVAPAWTRRKFDRGTGKPMQYMSPLTAALFWVIENLFSGMLRRRAPYHRVRYEDFISSPQDVLDEICLYFEPLRGDRVQLMNGHTANLETIHAISGNPDRFNTGPTTIGNVVSKRTSFLPRLVVMLIGFPFLLLYGYFA